MENHYTEQKFRLYRRPDFSDKRRNRYKNLSKIENLFLYITFNSSHPPGLLISLATGRLGVYWEHNTRERDFIFTTRLLVANLLDRGYSKEPLRDIFETAAERIDEKLMVTKNYQKIAILTKITFSFTFRFTQKTHLDKRYSGYIKQTASKEMTVLNV